MNIILGNAELPKCLFNTFLTFPMIRGVIDSTDIDESSTDSCRFNINAHFLNVDAHIQNIDTKLHIQKCKQNSSTSLVCLQFS